MTSAPPLATPECGLIEHVGADQGALAQITQKLGAVTEVIAAFARGIRS